MYFHKSQASRGYRKNPAQHRRLEGYKSLMRAQDPLASTVISLFLIYRMYGVHVGNMQGVYSA